MEYSIGPAGVLKVNRRIEGLFYTLTPNRSHPYKTRTIRREVGYAQDVRYFAIEHMDVRREAFQAGTAYKKYTW